jgi:hypothetical protein
MAYDEGGLSAHWFGKNFSAVFGYGSIELGATMIMGKLYPCLLV